MYNYPNYYAPYQNGYVTPNFNGMGQSQPSYQNQSNIAQNGSQRFTNKVYVSGVEGARSYQLSPNSEAILCDDTNSVIYDVVVDQNGKRSVVAYDIVEHKEAPPIDFSQFATKDDIAKLKEELTKRPIQTVVQKTV